MMFLDKEKWNNNYKNILLILVVLFAIIIFTFIFNKSNELSTIGVELEESGNPNISKVVINEVMNNNDGFFADEEGNTYDWIEIYNGTNNDINLENYTLSDEESSVKWAFGDTVVKSKSYIIVFLSGDNRDGLYANFKLNKNGGEKLVLKSANGRVIDAVETVKTNKNNSLARDLNGKWKIVNKATPGYNNTNEAYNMFLNSLVVEDNSIEITEILIKNGGQFVDNYGDYSGYIEITNVSKEKINLKNYSLSDNINEPFKWNLPDIEIQPGEVLLIYTSGRDITDEDILHTSFNLDSKRGNVILSKNGKVIKNVPYENLPNGYALMLISGKYEKTGVLSGGYNNTTDGSEEFAEKYQQNKNSLIINEVMNDNYSYLAQNGYEFYDWIELKNNSDEEIKLSDYYITTSINDMTMYKLPDVVLKPNELYIIMASGDINLSNNSYNHANFKLSSTESLYVVKENKIIDSIFISNIPTGFSYGRDDAYGFIYMENPTPKKENNSGKYEVAYVPEFSIEAGVYNNIETISLEINAPGTIYYTLNGSVPTTNSNIYTEPILIDETTVVKAINVENGKFDSDYITSSYIVNENHTLPVVSVSLRPSNFSNLEIDSWNEALEYESYIELFEDESLSFSIPCGFKLFGGSTRGLDKKSFAVKFRKEYGESKLNYQVFENRDNSVYDTLVLRSGSQDYNVSMIRDPLMTSLIDETEVDVQSNKPVVLYINGNYWGVYYLMEKVDENFISSHYNVDPDLTNIVRIDGEVMVGSKRDYVDIIDYVNTHNMANANNYEYIKEKIDIDNLITFWVAETYITNNDIINCRFFSHPDIDDGKWHLIFYDLDYAMYNYGVNYFTFMTQIEGMSDFKVPTDLMRNLLKNSEFRTRFVEILSNLLKNELKDEKILNKIDELYDLIAPEMERNQKRWNLTMDDWNDGIDELKNFVKKRKSYLLNQTQDYFNLTDKQMKEYFGEIL